MLHPRLNISSENSKLRRPRPHNNVSQYRPLIDDITLMHGPFEALGSIILKAYVECKKVGVFLSLAPIELLVHLNAQHRDSWAPLLGVFDHRHGLIDRANSYLIIGRDSQGTIIYTRAARLYEISSSNNFAKMTEAKQHIYSGDACASNTAESWSVSGAALGAMKGISGRVAFSGAVWCHPTFRKKGFTHIASHLGRAYSCGLWNADYTVTFMAGDVVKGGHAKKTGYSNVAWAIHARGASIGDLDIAFLWMDRAEALSLIKEELRSPVTEINRRVVNR